MKKRDIYILGIACSVALLLGTSCTQRSLNYLPDPDPVPDPEPDIEQSCLVSLFADWSGAGIDAPAGTRFYFYPQAGGELVSKECGPEGFEGELPEGSYRVLAVGTPAVGVTFTHMESYETAAAVATPIVDPRTRSGMQEIAQPEQAYSLPIHAISPTRDNKVTQTSLPVSLVRTVQLTFSTSGTVRPVSLSGSLQGVYPSVLLSTGVPTAAEQTAAIGSQSSFDATFEGSDAKVRIRTLGVLNPEGGTVYTNLLRVSVLTADGETLTAVADLTAELTQGITANGGVIPLTLSLNIKIEVTPAGATATVQGWGNGGDTGSDVWE